MVAEPEDVEMEELQLPAQMRYSAVTVRMSKSPLFFVGEMVKRFTPVVPKPKANRGAKAQLDDAKLKIRELEDKVRQLEQAAEGPCVECVELRRRVEEISHDMKRGQTVSRSEVNAAERQMKRSRVDKDELKDANSEKYELKKKMTAMKKKEGMLEGALAMQLKIVDGYREDLNNSVHKDIYDEKVAALVEAEAESRELQRKLDTEQEELDSVKEALDEATAGPGSGRHADANAPAFLAAMKEEVGIKSKYTSAPARARPAGVMEWEKLSVRHISAVLKGRGEGDDINMIAQALERHGYLERLVDTKLFQPYAKNIARSAIGVTQDHWSALHAVHVWDQLELSRRQMETLGHLLSDIYHPGADKYVATVAWRNPFNPNDILLTPRLAGRKKREQCFESIAEEMNIVVGEDGRCERDAGALTSELYSKYAKALRDNYSDERPAQPVLFLDGTGGSLGRGICHGEMGCADFKKVGESDTKQSRATLQPLFLYQGNDHAAPLRANLDLSIKSYNKLVADGCFDRISIAGVRESTPARPITAADMQGAKTTYGMRECSHSVWCKCQVGGADGPQHAYPTTPFETYEQVLEYIESMGCEMKTFEEMCSWAHYSAGVAKGGAFTPVECNCCGYKASTEAKWRADMAAYEKLSDEEKVARQRAHMDSDDPLNSWQKHFHQVLFMPPLPHHGMDRCGVDHLHLVFLNLFKHLFRYTIHDGLPESKKKIVADYLKAAGFYSYDANSTDEDPVSHWIGREVKRFIEESHKHLPFLLQLAAAPADCVTEMAAFANEDGEQEMDDDDEYSPTEADIEQEEKEEPLMMADATRWDNFIELVASAAVEWPQGDADTDSYRKGRAVKHINIASVVANDLHELKPTGISWVPHILVFIVTLQMVLLGDPMRRSCDACESFGAMVKKIIKHSTCRRRLGKGQVDHFKGSTDRRWKQTFKRGYIEQAFRRVCVRESLAHGEANAPFLQRKAALRVSTGKAAPTAPKFLDGTPVPARPSIYSQCCSLASGERAM